MIEHEKIKKLMQEKGITSKELAEEIGISEAMTSYILRGLREPNVITLVRIARVLECSVDSLLKQ